MRSHPYRLEGGIFIFPSIHYFLSAYKRHPISDDRRVASAIRGLNRLLGGKKDGGYPEGRCTAFIGSRGGHKSHLGYVEILSQILESKKRGSQRRAGLVVSLRDDEGLTRSTMEGILKHQFPRKHVSLDSLIQDGRLEIMYYPPGYITPEEFFHRLLLSIQRLKHDGSAVSLLFNSLDQLAARFPLCARERIFIPGIVHMLTAEQVTSFFVAARDSPQPDGSVQAGYYGLESMAELILEFESFPIAWGEYCTRLASEGKFKEPALGLQAESYPGRTLVGLTVVRFAGGRAAGAKGALDLVESVHDPAHDIFGRLGLHYCPVDAQLMEETR